MTFAEFETSKEGGTPLELYLFELGGERFGYTTGEDNFTHQTVEYIAAPVSRTSVVATADHKDSKLTVKLPGNNTFARLYIGVIPGEFPEVTIRQIHRDDPDQESIVVFEGFVSTVGFTDDVRKSQITCRPLTSASGRLIPRQSFQGLCNHTLYDPRCTEAESANEEFGIIDSFSERTVNVSGVSNLTGGEAKFWINGYIQLGSEFRMIMVQSNNVMTLDLPFLENPIGAAVRMLPGCDHDIEEDCLKKYGGGLPDGNTVNHSGFPHVALKNPFEGLD